MNIVEYADRDMLAIDLANVLAGELENSLFTHDRVSFAVPGGSTPGPIFDNLCAADLDWSRVHVMLTDERWVDADHAQSNARLIRDRLLTSRAARADFTPYFTAGLTAAEAAEQLSEALTPELPISVLVLGMGADMHTASLFPGAEGLDEAMAADAPHLCAIRVPGQEFARITLSAPVLEGALSKHLVIYGEDKRAALEAAMKLPPTEAPVGAVLGEATVHWAA